MWGRNRSDWTTKTNGEIGILKGTKARVWDFVNELVCMAGTAQWPWAKSWQAIDVRLKITPKTRNDYLFMIEINSSFLTFPPTPSLRLLLSQLLFFCFSPSCFSSFCLLCYWRKNGVDCEKQLPVIYLSFFSSDNEFQVKGEIIIFVFSLSRKIKATGRDSTCHNMQHAIWD